MVIKNKLKPTKNKIVFCICLYVLLFAVYSIIFNFLIRFGLFPFFGLVGSIIFFGLTIGLTYILSALVIAHTSKQSLIIKIFVLFAILFVLFIVIGYFFFWGGAVLF